MDRVKGKVAIVTGSGNGIGEATAKLLAREGAKVAIIDIDDENGKRVAREIQTAGGAADFWHLNIADKQGVERVFAAIYEKYGKLNILVNNAGIPGGRCAPFDLTEEEWDRVMNVNLKGTFFCNKFATPYMIKSGGGSIVNVASVYGIIGCDTPVYDASKGAMRAMTKSDAIVLSKFNIRVNSVHPGNIDTPLFRKLVERIGGGVEYTARILSAPVPMKRMGTPEEIAYGILFLASDEASYVTAAELVMDGGMLNAPLPIYPENPIYPEHMINPKK
jgi:NAD(P)-dependent dehydrogenase (short-subunit alcohol dehydrogenase family)